MEVDACQTSNFYPRLGIAKRNDTGLLVYKGDDLQTAELNIGAMLKTPSCRSTFTAFGQFHWLKQKQIRNIYFKEKFSKMFHDLKN